MAKILVVRTCAVGDFILNLPALIALDRSSRQKIRFSLLGNPSTVALASAFVNVESIHSMDVQPWSRLFYEALPGLEFDSAIVWMKDPVVADNLARSGVANVIHARPFPDFGHAADHLLRTLHLPRPAMPDLWRPASADIVVHSGSGSARKNWPFYEQLMRRLPGSRLLPRNSTLLELAGYFRSIRAFIGNDSGITHLAAFLGCPTIALFGPTDPRVWGPIGRRCRVIWKTRIEDISVDEIVSCLSNGTNA
jgi:ADP-heptose:LPS heptosyltransferase